MKKLIKRLKFSRWAFIFVLLSFVVSIGYVTVMLCITPGGENAVSYSGRHRSDYLLMLLQCCLGVLALFLPSFLSHRFKIRIPSGMLIMYVVFLYCAIFLGEVRSFYYAVPFWDSILHFFSGGMLGCLGFSVVRILNNDKKVPVTLSPAFVAFFAFCFAIMIGAFWEIYEFTGDGLFGLNMQKYMLENGTQLVGRAALGDTMKDIIVDFCGAGLACIIGYFSIKLHKRWFNDLILEVEHSAPAGETSGKKENIRSNKAE